MKTKSFSDMDCSIARTLEQVGSWWSLLIVREAMMGVRRFRQFEKTLGISKNTLASRLNDLVAGGILRKAAAEDGSGYEEYLLTKKGRDLAPVMMALAQWGDRWAAHEGGGLTPSSTRKRTEISEIRPRRDDGQSIPLSEINVKPLKAAAKKGDEEGDVPAGERCSDQPGRNLMMARLFLGLNAAVIGLIGLVYLYDPNLLLGRYGLETGGAGLDNMLRSTYGGVFVGVAAIFLLGALHDTRSRDALALAAIFMGGLALAA